MKWPCHNKMLGVIFVLISWLPQTLRCCFSTFNAPSVKPPLWIRSLSPPSGCVRYRQTDHLSHLLFLLFLFFPHPWNYLPLMTINRNVFVIPDLKPAWQLVFAPLALSCTLRARQRRDLHFPPHKMIRVLPKSPFCQQKMRLDQQSACLGCGREL